MKKEEKKKEEKKELGESLIRIMSTDIPVRMNVYSGLTRIKGISWSFSNAICKTLKISRSKKIGELSQDEIKKIGDFAREPKLPVFLLNRRKDFEKGTDRHLTGSALDLEKEFDIKRMKKIKSYKGLRHMLGQPARGQRTKSHFREGKSMGVMNKPKAGKK